MQAEDRGNRLTTIGSGNLGIVTAANGHGAVRIPVTAPTSLTSGTYYMVITINYAGTTIATNNSATSTNTFTV